MLLKNLLRENSELKALNDNLQKEVTDMNRNQDKNETSVQVGFYILKQKLIDMLL